MLLPDSIVCLNQPNVGLLAEYSLGADETTYSKLRYAVHRLAARLAKLTNEADTQLTRTRATPQAAAAATYPTRCTAAPAAAAPTVLTSVAAAVTLSNAAAVHSPKRCGDAKEAGALGGLIHGKSGWQQTCMRLQSCTAARWRMMHRTAVSTVCC